MSKSIVTPSLALLLALALPACTQPATLLVALPDYCNTPDGMALQPDGSIILSVPNFNDEKAPPLLMRITPDNKAEPFYRFPTPYPGLPEKTARLAPMGIARAPSGDLYFADMQYMRDPNQASRLWKLTVRGGQVEKMTLVASGFNVANGLAIRDGYVYVTESVLEDAYPLTSAVLRFKLDEENVKLATPLRNDPHVIATFQSVLNEWRFGADGIAFDKQGNLYVGLFGDGELRKLEFGPDGKVKSNTRFAFDLGKMVSCDGMSYDPRTGNLYIADCAANAIRIVGPDGSIRTLAASGDVADKLSGGLDEPCEALLRGDTIVVANMDWPFPNFVNTKWQQPATLSVIKLPAAAK